jgi:hypothetical protein
MRTEPKNPKDMTDEERMALPDFDAYIAATTGAPKRIRARGIQPDDLLYFVGTDDQMYESLFYDGRWYRIPG